VDINIWSRKKGLAGSGRDGEIGEEMDEKMGEERCESKDAENVPACGHFCILREYGQTGITVWEYIVVIEFGPLAG
jgi:hypothetical protein